MTPAARQRFTIVAEMLNHVAIMMDGELRGGTDPYILGIAVAAVMREAQEIREMVARDVVREQRKGGDAPR